LRDVDVGSEMWMLVQTDVDEGSERCGWSYSEMLK
jgi:hypothetical protein